MQADDQDYVFQCVDQWKRYPLLCEWSVSLVIAWTCCVIQCIDLGLLCSMTRCSGPLSGRASLLL